MTEIMISRYYKVIFLLLTVCLVSLVSIGQIGVETHGRSVYQRNASSKQWSAPAIDYEYHTTFQFYEDFTKLQVYKNGKIQMIFKLTNLKKTVNSNVNEWTWKAYDYADEAWYEIIYDMNKYTYNINTGSVFIEYKIVTESLYYNGQ